MFIVRIFVNDSYLFYVIVANFTDTKMKISVSILFCAVIILPKINGKETEYFTPLFLTHGPFNNAKCAAVQ